MSQQKRDRRGNTSTEDLVRYLKGYFKKKNLYLESFCVVCQSQSRPKLTTASRQYHLRKKIDQNSSIFSLLPFPLHCNEILKGSNFPNYFSPKIGHKAKFWIPISAQKPIRNHQVAQIFLIKSFIGSDIICKHNLSTSWRLRRIFYVP